MADKNLHTLVIDKLVPGGLGLGRLPQGMVVLVQHVLPGEEVIVREVSRKKDYVTATLEKIITPSPDRIEPPCPVYGRCGGCDLQHAAPAAQLLQKKAILADSLQRAPGDIFFDAAPFIETPVASPRQFGYRQRIRLQVDSRRNFGFFQPGSHVVEPVSRCLLAKDELNGVLEQLHSADIFQDLLQHCPAFELLFDPAGADTFLLLHFKRKPRPSDCLLCAELQQKTSGLARILLQTEGYGLYDPIAQTFLPSPPVLSCTLAPAALADKLSLTWEAGGFCQVNLEQNSSMVDIVLEMVAAGLHNRVLDLYCGYGNFSLPVAKLGAEVLGIDLQNSAIRSAKRNTLQNNIANCEFAKKEVPAAVKSLIEEGRIFDTIILDPPRQGAPETVALLPKLGAERIIYISCSPTTLARDITALLPAGYRLSRLVPVDMFPQTHHLESIALLRRSPG